MEEKNLWIKRFLKDIIKQSQCMDFNWILQTNYKKTK